MKATIAASLERRPAADEHSPYYGRYISRVPDGNIVRTLETQLAPTMALLSGLNDEQSSFRYAPGKWSVKQVLGHMLDTERVFMYRAMAAARGEPAALPSFEQDDYVANANFDARSLRSLLEELQAVRGATVALVGSLDDDALSRRVMASGNPVTARALAWITAGHELHHRGELREKYIRS